MDTLPTLTGDQAAIQHILSQIVPGRLSKGHAIILMHLGVGTCPTVNWVDLDTWEAASVIYRREKARQEDLAS